jgi:hypothetical protein
MTDSLTDDDKVRALKLAAESMEGALKRWAKRVAAGQTDEQLTQALEYEFGQFGGSFHDDIGVTYQGNGLKLWADRCIGSRSKSPILEGQKTVTFARRVYGIADPEDKQRGLF